MQYLISKFTTFFGSLGCVHERKWHTISCARMHIAKFLEVGTQNGEL
jgi:hypothetical protein